MPLKFRPLALVFALSVSIGAQAAPADLEKQRQLFVKTYRNLEAGQTVDLRKLDKQLGDYVLRPYLDHLALRARLNAASSEQVERHLETHADLAVTPQLRQQWLERLAQARRWREFTRFDNGSDSPELRCYRLQAGRTNKGVDRDWIVEAKSLWMVGKSQPSACDPVFDELYRRGAIGHDDVWRRTRLAMGKGDVSLAARLAPRLDAEHQGWFRQWMQIHKRPETALDKPAFDLEDPRARILINHGIYRIAPKDPEQAMKLVGRFERIEAFGAGEAAILRRHIALQAAYSRDARALAWFEALPPAMQDDDVQLWQARLTLGQQDWPRLLSIVESMSPAYRQENEWRFWHAHALQATGQTQAAEREYRELAGQRNYYGFLAADRIDQPYNLNDSPATFPETALTELAARLDVRRAREFFELGMLPEARREWDRAVARLSTDEQGVAAVLAARWGWHDRAIIAANRAGLNDSLDLRFPLAFRDQVELYSRQNGLDPTLTLAVLRKESAFRPDAISAVGALGLMQVMPSTARQVAKMLQETPPSAAGLLEVDTNLKLGSAYLRQVLDRFGDNPVLAAAAYNAGPHRVDTWLARHPDMPTAVWIENISFAETRDYVKSILAFSTVFDAQMNKEPRRLSDRLKPIVASMPGG